MPEAFQRLFHRSDLDYVQSLNVQAALGPVLAPERSQFSLLVRHFLERFFNHETASTTGDGKTRMVQIACAAGLPGLMVAIYLWPTYHPFPGWPPGRTAVGPPPYWAQVNHHFFFVMYSFVVMGLITLFEWDLLFPDLLDVFVLGTLPIPHVRLFLSRLAAIAVLVAGALFDANFLAPIVLPLATDPPRVVSLLAGHLSAVGMAGLFAAGSVLALQSTMLALLGEKLFRRISLPVQAASVASFLVLLLLFPMLSGITPGLLQAGGGAARWFPPFWFLAIYQQHLAAPSHLFIWPPLARAGYMATAFVWTVAAIAYPWAHVRRIRAMVEGTSLRAQRPWFLAPWHRLLHVTVFRSPLRRAIQHFIGQTLLRVPRYRIYLVLYGGVGFSLVVATILRLTVRGSHLQVQASADGMRVAIGIVAFWVIAGLRTTFASSGNQRGSWIFRVIQGTPPQVRGALDLLQAAIHWAMLSGLFITFGAIALLQLVAPPELRDQAAVTAQLVVGAGVCLLLSDIFFLHVTTLPFMGEAAAEQENLAFAVLRYVTCFPLVTWLALVCEKWMEPGGVHLGIAIAATTLVHLWLRKRHQDVVRQYCDQLSLEEGEEEFPMKLGLRY